MACLLIPLSPACVAYNENKAPGQGNNREYIFSPPLDMIASLGEPRPHIRQAYWLLLWWNNCSIADSSAQNRYGPKNRPAAVPSWCAHKKSQELMRSVIYALSRSPLLLTHFPYNYPILEISRCSPHRIYWRHLSGFDLWKADAWRAGGGVCMCGAHPRLTGGGGESWRISESSENIGNQKSDVNNHNTKGEYLKTVLVIFSKSSLNGASRAVELQKLQM